MVWKVRRVVTGHDKNGKSILLMDGYAPNVKEMASMPGLALTDLWETKAPASNEGVADGAARPVRLEPPKGGALFRIVEFPPDTAWRGRAADARAAFDSIQAGHAPDLSSADPMMHKTDTVDFIVVLKGEIYAVVDTGETLLRPGDVFVQRGTNHSWSVRGTEPCIIAVVLVSAKPVGKAKAAAKTSAAKKSSPKKPAPKPSRRRPKKRR